MKLVRVGSDGPRFTTWRHAVLDFLWRYLTRAVLNAGIAEIYLRYFIASEINRGRQPMGELAQWKSHKIVKAGKILAFPPSFSGPVTVEDCNGVGCKVDCPPNVFARGRPNLGDYIVIYDDGYKSWSPAKAFEEGYTRVP